MSDKLERAKAMRKEAERLELEAFNERPLPDKWQVGMRVRFLNTSEGAWCKGQEATINELDHTDRPASEYQVFWTVPDGGGAVWWTTPSDVELVKKETS
jgi:hypothetical protein